MSVIVKTAGSTGRQYATPQLAIDSIPKDLVASGNSYIVDIYNDSAFTGTARLLNITGFTTADATHNITVRAAAGQSFRDSPNVLTNALQFNAANGVSFSMTANYEYAIYSDAPYTVFDGLQVRGTNYTAGAAWVAGANSQIRNCIFESKPQISASAFVLRLADGDGTTAINTVVINNVAGSRGVSLGVSGKVVNCTIVSPADTIGASGISVFGASAVINNCAIFGYTQPIAAGVAPAADGHNATDAATFDGATTGSLTSRTYSTQFQNTATISTLDLRLKTGSVLIDAGSTTSDATSISGLTRPSGAAFDIGAWEFASAPVAPNAPTIGTASSGPASAIVTFTPPVNNGGSTITGYTATSSPGAFTGTGSASPLTVIGLTNGTAYTFTVTATNAIGTGVASAASNSTTPAAAATGTVTTQPAPDGQSQRFAGTTINAVSASYTLTGSAGGVTRGPAAVTITTNAFDFTVTALTPGTYTPALTVTNSQGGTTAMTGTTAFTIAGVGGGGEVPINPSAGGGGGGGAVSRILLRSRRRR